MPNPAKIFISYNHNKTDRDYLDRLLKQLAPLARAGKVSIWEDAQIRAGQIWEHEVKTKLAEADIIIMLLSADYFASNFINDVEIPMAMAQHAAHQSHIVPVLLRSCGYAYTDIKNFEILPKTAHDQRLVPVDRWDSADDALDTVVHRVNQLLQPPAASPVVIPVTPSKTSAKPSISDRERKGYEAELELAIDKLHFLQKSLLIEAGAAARFQLEQQIKDLETRITEIKSRLEA